MPPAGRDDPDRGETAPDVGRRVEEAARRYLTGRGLREVARNFRCRVGEIDLVMRDGDCLVFVEVRYRRSERFGGAAESIVARKRRRLWRAAQYYLQTHGEYAGLAARFDVVAVRPGPSGLSIEWITDAFRA